MTETIKLDGDIANETKILEIFDRAVKLFEKTGLNDLAEKWNRILKTYMSCERLHDLI